MEIARAALASWGVRPAAVIDHSLGEYAAACRRRFFSEDTLRIVSLRGRLLESIDQDGLMVVTMASVTAVEAAILKCRARVAIAAVNGPANVVLAGVRRDVLTVVEILTAQGFKCTPLPIAQASHSPLVDSLLDQFEAAVEAVRSNAPQVPIVSNVTGDWMQSAPDAAYWRRHLREPVRFAEGLATLRRHGTYAYLEIGPHRALATIGEQADDARDTLWVASMIRGRDPRLTLREAVAELWMRGAHVEWRALFSPTARKTSSPTYAFQRRRYWLPERAASTVDRAEALTLRRVSIADAGTRRVFETTIDAAANDANGRHRVSGVPIASTATLLDLALSAAHLPLPVAFTAL